MVDEPNEHAIPAAKSASGRLPNAGAVKPIGASAFIAREKGRKGGRVGLLLATVSAIGVGAVVGAWALAGQNPALSETAPVAARTQTADAEAERRRAQAEKRAAQEREAREISENRKQIEALEKRREELQRQVAELTAPLTPDADELEAARSKETPASERQAVRDDAETEPKAEPATEKAAFAAAAIAEDAPAPIEPPKAPTGVDVAAVPAPQADTPSDARSNGPVRVFIHVRARDPEARARAQAIAEDLRRRGVEVAGIRGVPHAVRNDMVRFFYDADESAVSELGRALETSSRRGAAPVTQDFRNRRIAPKPGTLEIWLS